MQAKNIVEALLNAQKRVQSLSKDATNTFMKYRYVKSDSIIEEARNALHESGLVLFTSNWEVQPAVVLPPTDEKTRTTNAKLVVNYQLFHPESDQSMSFKSETSILVEAGKPSDKAEAAALTFGLAYFLRGLLLIPRSDEEPDQRDDRAYGATTKNVVVSSAKSNVDAKLEELLGELRVATDVAQLAVTLKSAKSTGHVKSPQFVEEYTAKYKSLKESGS